MELKSQVFNTDTYVNRSFKHFGQWMLSPKMVREFRIRSTKVDLLILDLQSDEHIAGVIHSYFVDCQFKNLNYHIDSFEEKMGECELLDDEDGLIATYVWCSDADEKDLDHLKGFDLAVDITNGEVGGLTEEDTKALYDGTDFGSRPNSATFKTKIKINSKLYSITTEHADGGWNAFYFKSEEFNK